MNRKITLRGVVLILLTAFLMLSGAVAAYMFKQTPEVKNQFEKAVVDCEVTEIVTEIEKTSVKIQNTGNIDAYLRVRFVSHWEDAAGNIVAKASVMPTIDYITADWVKGTGDTYYCKTAIAPGASTPEMIESPIAMAKDGEYYQVVEVFAEAIQSKPADAVTGSWGVSVDSSGTITSAN